MLPKGGLCGLIVIIEHGIFSAIAAFVGANASDLSLACCVSSGQAARNVLAGRYQGMAAHGECNKKAVLCLKAN